MWGPLIDWMRDDCGHTNKLGPYKWTPDSGPGKKGAWVRTKVESTYEAAKRRALGIHTYRTGQILRAQKARVLSCIVHVSNGSKLGCRYLHVS